MSTKGVRSAQQFGWMMMGVGVSMLWRPAGCRRWRLDHRGLRDVHIMMGGRRWRGCQRGCARVINRDYTQRREQRWAGQQQWRHRRVSIAGIPGDGVGSSSTGVHRQLQQRFRRITYLGGVCGNI